MTRKQFLFSAIMFSLCSGLYIYSSKLNSFLTSLKNSEPKKTTYYNYVPILCFHNLEGKGKYAISQFDFREYLEIIRKENLTVLPLKTLLAHSRQNKLLISPSIAITIDDDFENIARVAVPVLREYNFPATLFVYTTEIKKSPKHGMSWEDLRRLHREGFEIQNHSYSHTKFHFKYKNESDFMYENRIFREITASKKILEKNIPGINIYSFAYPMGYYNDHLNNKLFSKGYQLVLTTDAKPVNLVTKFNGIFHRFTIENKKTLHSESNRFFKEIASAKTPYYANDDSPETISSLSNP